MMSIKNVFNDLQAWEYVKINVAPDSISWSPDSVTSTNSFRKYYLNGTLGAKK